MVYLDQNAAILNRHVTCTLDRGLVCEKIWDGTWLVTFVNSISRPIISVVSLLIVLGDSSGSYKQHGSKLAVNCSFHMRNNYQNLTIWFYNRIDNCLIYAGLNLTSFFCISCIEHGETLQFTWIQCLLTRKFESYSWTYWEIMDDRMTRTLSRSPTRWDEYSGTNNYLLPRLIDTVWLEGKPDCRYSYW